jgi:hypothetical protein
MGLGWSNTRMYSLAITVTAIALAAALLHPATSPFARFRDADGDGFTDAKDAFPDDALEWDDSDLDGVGDNGDVFPLDASEWNDTDGDGYGDNMDQFRSNPGEWNDTDGDGYGDNAQDSFPLDALEWHDTDGDGVGDNGDFKVNGNGIVQVSVERFGGWYEDFAALDKVDPYFTVTVTENMANGTVFTHISPVFLNTTHLLNNTACVFVCDIDDGADIINVTVVVKDAAGDTVTANDCVIDYTGNAASRYVTYQVAEPFNVYRRNDGMRDNVSNELDCEIGILVEQYPRALQTQNPNATVVSKTVSFETQAFDGWVLNGTYGWVEGYYFVQDLKNWNDLFNEYYYYDPATDFVPDFRNSSYVLADWGTQNGLYSIRVVGIELENTTLNVFVEKTIPSTYWGEVTHVCHFVRVPNDQLLYQNITQTVFYEYEEVSGFSTGSVVLFYIHI